SGQVVDVELPPLQRQQAGNGVVVEALPELFRRKPADDGIRRHIAVDECAGTDDGAVPDGHAAPDGDIGPDPDVVADRHQPVGGRVRVARGAFDHALRCVGGFGRIETIALGEEGGGRGGEPLGGVLGLAQDDVRADAAVAADDVDVAHDSASEIGVAADRHVAVEHQAADVAAELGRCIEPDAYRRGSLY